MTDAIRKGKVVSVTYTLHDERGQIFEQSDIPVPYLHGYASGLFDKIEQQLVGKHTGDSIEAILSPEEGFGPHDPALSFTDDLENVPLELRVLGAGLEAQNAKGEMPTFVVKRIEKDKLTVDANHALAGQTVKFRVKVLDVRDASPDELRAGQPGASGLTLQ